MAEGLYRIGECIYMEVYPPPTPYQICKIEELRKNSKGGVEVAVKCFYRRRDLPSQLLGLADQHALALEEENIDEGYPPASYVEDLRSLELHLVKHRELFLSRQIETFKIDMVSSSSSSNSSSCVAKKQLIMMRGLPGSGKSTLAKKLEGSQGIICSTDDFFCENGRYKFDPSNLAWNHSRNKTKAEKAMCQGFSPVIIDNTNLSCQEMDPYVEMGLQYGYSIELVEPDTPWRYNLTELARYNRHGIPEYRIERMMGRFDRGVTAEKMISRAKQSGNVNTIPLCKDGANTGVMNQQVSIGTTHSSNRTQPVGPPSESVMVGQDELPAPMASQSFRHSTQTDAPLVFSNEKDIQQQQQQESREDSLPTPMSFPRPSSCHTSPPQLQWPDLESSDATSDSPVASKPAPTNRTNTDYLSDYVVLDDSNVDSPSSGDTFPYSTNRASAVSSGGQFSPAYNLTGQQVHRSPSITSADLNIFAQAVDLPASHSPGCSTSGQLSSTSEAHRLNPSPFTSNLNTAAPFYSLAFTQPHSELLVHQAATKSHSFTDLDPIEENSSTTGKPVVVCLDSDTGPTNSGDEVLGDDEALTFLKSCFPDQADPFLLHCWGCSHGNMNDCISMVFDLKMGDDTQFKLEEDHLVKANDFLDTRTSSANIGGVALDLEPVIVEDEGFVLKLTPSLAHKLQAMFGSVQHMVDGNELSGDDLGILLSEELAESIYTVWKETLQAKRDEIAVRNQLENLSTGLLNSAGTSGQQQQFEGLGSSESTSPSRRNKRGKRGGKKKPGSVASALIPTTSNLPIPSPWQPLPVPPVVPSVTVQVPGLINIHTHGVTEQLGQQPGDVVQTDEYTAMLEEWMTGNLSLRKNVNDLKKKFPKAAPKVMSSLLIDSGLDFDYVEVVLANDDTDGNTTSTQPARPFSALQPTPPLTSPPAWNGSTTTGGGGAGAVFIPSANPKPYSSTYSTPQKSHSNMPTSSSEIASQFEDECSSSSSSLYQHLASPQYKDFRAEAQQHAELCREQMQKAGKAYAQKQTQLAAYYREMGQQHRVKMQEANRRAAEMIYIKNSAKHSPNTIDLHGLHVEEALQILAEKLLQSSGEVEVITGRGLHSQGNIPRLKKAVINYLYQHRINYCIPPENPGMVKVRVPQNLHYRR